MELGTKEAVAFAAGLGVAYVAFKLSGRKLSVYFECVSKSSFLDRITGTRCQKIGEYPTVLYLSMLSLCKSSQFGFLFL